jgi:hypothetical protein
MEELERNIPAAENNSQEEIPKLHEELESVTSEIKKISESGDSNGLRELTIRLETINTGLRNAFKKMFGM